MLGLFRGDKLTPDYENIYIYIYTFPENCIALVNGPQRGPLRRISCHGRNYSQPYFFKRNQSSDNRSHGFGAKFLLTKLSASDFSYERKSALTTDKCWFDEGMSVIVSMENT